MANIALLVGGIILISVGFSADKQQSDAMRSLPKLVDNVVGWTDQVQTVVASSNANIQVINTQLTVIIGTGLSIDTTGMATAADDAEQMVTDIESAADIDMSDLSNKFSDDGTCRSGRIVVCWRQGRPTIQLFRLRTLPPTNPRSSPFQLRNTTTNAPCTCALCSVCCLPSSASWALVL